MVFQNLFGRRKEKDVTPEVAVCDLHNESEIEQFPKKKKPEFPTRVLTKDANIDREIITGIEKNETVDWDLIVLQTAIARTTKDNGTMYTTTTTYADGVAKSHKQLVTEGGEIHEQEIDSVGTGGSSDGAGDDVSYSDSYNSLVEDRGDQEDQHSRKEEQKRAEALHPEEAKRKEEEAKKKLLEAKRLEEQKRIEEQRLLQEQKRIEEEKRLKEQKQREEEKRKEEQKRLEEQKRKAEQKRLEEQKRKAEQKRLEEQKRKAEQKRLEEQKRKEEQKRLEEQKRKAEQKRLEEQKRKEEQKRLEEQKRKAEQKRLEEQKRKEEQKRLEEQKRKEEQKRLEEQKRKAEQKRLEEQKRKEEQKQREEQRRKEEQKRLEEQKRKEALALEKEKLQVEKQKRRMKKEKKQMKKEKKRIEKEKKRIEKQKKLETVKEKKLEVEKQKKLKIKKLLEEQKQLKETKLEEEQKRIAINKRQNHQNEQEQQSHVSLEQDRQKQRQQQSNQQMQDRLKQRQQQSKQQIKDQPKQRQQQSKQQMQEQDDISDQGSLEINSSDETEDDQETNAAGSVLLRVPFCDIAAAMSTPRQLHLLMGQSPGCVDDAPSAFEMTRSIDEPFDEEEEDEEEEEEDSDENSDIRKVAIMAQQSHESVESGTWVCGSGGSRGDTASTISSPGFFPQFCTLTGLSNLTLCSGPEIQKHYATYQTKTQLPKGIVTNMVYLDMDIVDEFKTDFLTNFVPAMLAKRAAKAVLAEKYFSSSIHHAKLILKVRVSMISEGQSWLSGMLCTADGGRSPFSGQGCVGLKWSIFDKHRIYNGGKFIITKAISPLSLQGGDKVIENLSQICAEDIANAINIRRCEV